MSVKLTIRKTVPVLGSQNIHPILTQRVITQENVFNVSVAKAKALWAAFRSEHGFAAAAPALLTPPSANQKLAKTFAYGLSLSPSDSSGINVCPNATESCRAACVAFAGKGAFHSVQRARITKTLFLVQHPEAFLRLVVHEIGKARNKHGDDLLVRLNTFSDIRWHVLFPWLFELFSDVQFYDYTKNWVGLDRIPANYKVALSDSERVTEDRIHMATGKGYNVAMVLQVKRGEAMPATWQGIPVIDADKSDSWMIGNVGVIGGLRPKGSMRFDDLMVRRVS